MAEKGTGTPFRTAPAEKKHWCCSIIVKNLLLSLLLHIVGRDTSFQLNCLRWSWLAGPSASFGSPV